MITTVNSDQCALIAKRITNLTFRTEFLNRSFLTFPSDNEHKLRCYFYAVLICHQTYNLALKPKNLYGWDVLESVFEQFARCKSPLIDPYFLSELSIDDLMLLLKPHFSPTRDPQLCTLDRLDERAEMMISSSEFLKTNFHGSVSELLKSSNSLLINRGCGLYEQFPKMEHWADPEFKKITFFLKLVHDAGIITLKDPENIVPIMDYHMQRVLMRTGAVSVDPETAEKLRNREPMTDDIQLRKTCISAMKIIAETAQFPLFSMNDIFYMLGRSCCNENPLCVTHTCEKSPCSLYKAVSLSEHKNCLFTGICKGESNIQYRSLWQPVVNTHFY